jgi:hypothetical protein
MNNTARNFITGLFIVAGSLQLCAQGSECDQKLSQAETEFNAGHFYSIPTILGDCPEGKLSQEQTVKAYLLLCQAYLILGNPLAADDSYLRLLKADPEYVANDKRDPIDVVYLSKKFTATPIFTPHLRLGFNTSFFRSIHTVSTEPYGDTRTSSPRLNVQVGGGIDWNIDDNISLCAELDFGSRAYRRVTTGIALGSGSSDEQTILANQLWLDAPLYLKYSDNRDRKLRPFGYLGLAFNFLISAKNTFEYVDNKSDGSQLSAVGPAETVTYQRNQFSRSWLIGGGVKYKVGKDFLYVDLRYMGGLSNLANTDELYYESRKPEDDKNKIGNPDYYLSTNVTHYRYVSDLFRLDNVSLSFGFIHPIYDPRKVKKAKTKSVERQIRKEEGGKEK